MRAFLQRLLILPIAHGIVFTLVLALGLMGTQECSSEQTHCDDEGAIIVNAVELSDSDVELLKRIELKLEAANDGRRLLAVWAPLADIFNSTVPEKLTKDMTGRDYSGLLAGIQGAKGLTKVTLLSIKQDCLEQEQKHRKETNLKRAQFWAELARTYQLAINKLGN
jgi:hypothetical protein